MRREEDKADGYEDIIHLPHHVSARHSHMSAAERAAQFLPFAALSGYGDVIQETARYVEEKIELDEAARALLDRKMNLLSQKLQDRPVICVTYFLPDGKKAGGSYVTEEGTVKKIDGFSGSLVFADGREIAAENILDFFFV